MASDIRIGVAVDSSQIKRLTSDLAALTTQASTLAQAFRAIPGLGSSTVNAPPAGAVSPPVTPLGVPLMPQAPSTAAIGPAATAGGQLPPNAAPLPPVPTPQGPGPQQAQAAPGGGGGGGGGGGRSRGGGSVLPARYGGAAGYGGGLVRGLLGFSVLAGGGYFLGSAIRSGVERESNREMSVADLYQRTGGSFGSLNDFTSGQSTYGPEETTQFAGASIGRAGMRGMGGYSGITNAMNRTRAFGFGTEEGAEMFGGAARQYGAGNTDKFAAAVAKAIADSQQNGLQGEVFESILHTNEELNKTLGMSQDASNAIALSIAAVVAGLGPNNKNPALTGAGLVGTLGNMASAGKSHSLFNVPDMGTALLAQAGQRSGLDFYQTNQALQFEPMGENWKKIMGNYIQGAEKMGPLKNYALEQMGVPVGAADDLMKAVKAHGIDSKEAQGELDKLQKQSQENAPQEIRKAQAQMAKDWAQVEAKLQPLFAKFETAVAALTTDILKFTGFFGGSGDPPEKPLSEDEYKKRLKAHGVNTGSPVGPGGGPSGGASPFADLPMLFGGGALHTASVEEAFMKKYASDPAAAKVGGAFSGGEKTGRKNSLSDYVDTMEVVNTKGGRELHIVYKSAWDNTTYAVDIPVTTTAKIPKAGAGAR